MNNATIYNRQQRHRTIVDFLLHHGFVRPSDLTTLTGASLMTVYRDLRELAIRGILRRYHGGVSIEPSTMAASSSEFRLLTNTTAKMNLAHAASSYISPGMSVMLDESTTVSAVAKLLPELGPLTVVTNYRQNIEVLRTSENIQLVTVSGEYSRIHDAFLGPPAHEMIASLSVDLVLQSTSAMTAHMTFHQQHDIALLKRAMLHSGSKNMLLMDASKLARRGPHQLADVDVFDHVLLSGPITDDLVTSIQQNTDVHLVTGPQAYPRGQALPQTDQSRRTHQPRGGASGR